MKEKDIQHAIKELTKSVNTLDGNLRYICMASLIIEVYKKGQRSGHNKAVELCANAVKKMLSANDNSY